MAETVLGRRLRSRGVPWGTLLRWLPRLPSLLRLVGRLLGDRRVPLWAKALLALIPLYLASPVDLVPELVAGLFGLTDDVAVALFLLRAFLRAVPADVLAEHLEAVRLPLP
jgi:uncharacterized membrane protein YkvA (DUF1232 family)